MKTLGLLFLAALVFILICILPTLAYHAGHHGR